MNWTSSEIMVVAAARRLAGERVCFVGIGLPNLACSLAQRTVEPDLELVYESGAVGARPQRLPILNALCAAETMAGFRGRIAHALPHEAVAEAWSARRA